MLSLLFLAACASTPRASYHQQQQAEWREANRQRWAAVDAENKRAMTPRAAPSPAPQAVASPAAAPEAPVSEACRDLKFNRRSRQSELESAERLEKEMCAASRPSRIAFVRKYGDTRTLRAVRAVWDAEHCERVATSQTKRTDLVVRGRDVIPVERVWADTKLVCKGERPPNPIENASRDEQIRGIAIENQNGACAGADYLARQRGEEAPDVALESKLERIEREITECKE